MTYEDEMAYRRQQQESLHVKNTAEPAPRRVQAGQQAEYKPFYDSQLKAKAPTHAAQLGSVPSFIPATSVPDTERMTQYLDGLTTQLRELTIHAEERLSGFVIPRPIAGDNATTDTRKCESPYFRILESRVEMMQYQIDYLAALLSCVSAPRESNKLQAAAA